MPRRETDQEYNQRRRTEEFWKRKTSTQNAVNTASSCMHKSNWISVYDALPLTTKEMPMSDIVFGTTGPNVIGLFRHYRGKWQHCPPIKEWPEPKVTHWMPLPNPPDEHDA